MRSRSAAATAAVLTLILAACGGGSDDASSGSSIDAATSDSTPDAMSTLPEPSGAEPDDVDASASTTSASTTTAPTTPATPPTEQRLTLVGAEEMVFDWTTDKCNDRNLPDTATRVVRDANGGLSVYLGEETTYRMTGPDFDSLVVDCTAPVMTSANDSDPAQFNDAEWISSTFTEDGETVYAIIHNEYIGLRHRDVFPDQCPSGDNFNCIDVTLTLGVSTDGGATFTDAAPAPDHMIATMPFVYDDEGVASGFWHPSNLVDPGDGYRYMLMDVAVPPESGQSPDGGEISPDIGIGYICALRTDDVSDPDAWRFWNGESFDGVIVDPYREDATDAELCAPVDYPALSAELTGSIVWLDSLEAFVTVGGSYEPGTNQENWGIYYSTSTDLIDWSPRRLLFESPLPRTQAEQADMTFLAYPTIIDHDSESPNFDTTDGEAHLYATRFNAGGQSLDRDLVRFPIALEEFVLEPAVWEFDTADDAAGWAAVADLSELSLTDGALTMTSMGDDPHMEVRGQRISADYDTITITMSADAGGPSTGQVFFQTEDDARWDGDKFAWFEVTGNGKPNTYEIDMSDVAGWDGVITALRIDPVEATPVDAGISIDAITVT